MRTRRFVVGAALAWLVLAGRSGPAAAQSDPPVAQSLQNTLGRKFRLTNIRAAIPRNADAGSGDLFTLDNTAVGAVPAYVNIESAALARLGWSPKVHKKLFAAGGPLDCTDPLVECPVAGVDPAAFANGAVAVHYDLAGPLPAATTGAGTFNLAVLTRDPSLGTAPDPRPNTPFVGVNTIFRFDATANGWDQKSFRLANNAFAAAPTNNAVLRRDPRQPDQGWIFIPTSEFTPTFTVYDLHSFSREGTVAGGDAAGTIPRGSLITIDPNATATVGLARTTASSTATTSDGGTSPAGIALIVGGVGIGLLGGGLLWRARRNAGGILIAEDSDDPRDAQWAAILKRNEAADQLVLTASTALGERLGKFYADYADASHQYLSTYKVATNGLVDLKATGRDNRINVQVAQEADKWINYINLARLGISLGRGGLGWRDWRRAQAVQAQRQVEQGAMQAINQQVAAPIPFLGLRDFVSVAPPGNLPAPPRWFTTPGNIDEAFEAPERAHWAMQQMAREANVDLEALMTRPDLSPDRVLGILRIGVAEARGLPIVGTNEWSRLFQLAQGYRNGDALFVGDLQWLFDWNRRQNGALVQYLAGAPTEISVQNAKNLADVGPSLGADQLRAVDDILNNQTIASAVDAGAAAPLHVARPDGRQVPLFPGTFMPGAEVPTPTGAFTNVLEPTTGAFPQVLDTPTGAFTNVLDPPTGAFTNVLDPPTGAFTNVLDPPTGAFPQVLEPPTQVFTGVLQPGGPIIGVGPGQGVVWTPPIVSPGGAIPDVPPTWWGRPPGIPATVDGEIPPTGGWSGGIPPTGGWSAGGGGAVDAGATAGFDGVLRDPGATGGFDAVLRNPAGTGAFDAVLRDPDATVDPGPLLGAGVQHVDDAVRMSGTFADDGRRMVVSGEAAPQLIRSIPGYTPMVRIAVPEPGALPQVTALPPLVSPYSIAGPAQGMEVLGPPLEEVVKTSSSVSEPLSFLIAPAHGDPPATSVGTASTEVAALGNLTEQIAPLASATGMVWIGEYQPASIQVVDAPGITPGTAMVFTALGTTFVDPAAPMLVAPGAPMQAGLAQGIADATLPVLTSFGPAIGIDPDDRASANFPRLQLQWDVQDLIHGGGFMLPSDYLDELAGPSADRDFIFLGLSISNPYLADAGWTYVQATTSPVEQLVKFLPYVGLYDLTRDDVNAYYGMYSPQLAAMAEHLSTTATELEWLGEKLPAHLADLEAAATALGSAAQGAINFGNEHPDWSDAHPGEVDAKVARDAATIDSVRQSIASLRQFQALAPKLAADLRNLRVDGQGNARSTDTLLHPTSMVRVTGAFLRVGDALAHVLLLAPPGTVEVLPAPATQAAADPPDYYPDVRRPTQEEAEVMRQEKMAALDAIPYDAPIEEVVSQDPEAAERLQQENEETRRRMERERRGDD